MSSVPRHCVHQYINSNWRRDRNSVYVSVNYQLKCIAHHFIINPLLNFTDIFTCDDIFSQICACDELDCGTCQAEKEAVLSATSWFESSNSYTKVDPSQSMIYVSEMQLHTDTSGDKR